MASCLGCGKDMKEFSRKLLKGEKSTYKVLYQCQNKDCSKKGIEIGFLDDGMMVIPLPDGQ